MGLAKTFLAIGIAIVFAVFIAYGMFVVYEPPQNECWKDYNCDKLASECYGYDKEELYEVPRPFPVVRNESQEQCYNDVIASDEYKTCLENRKTCNDVFEPMQYNHARNSFFVLAVISLLAIIIGFHLSRLEGIGSGILGGGILIILWSLIYTHAFWENWNKFIKLFALFIVLVLLIFLGYKKIEKHTKRK